MTPADRTTPGAKSLSLDFDLPHAPEKVWRALTDADLLAQWLLPTVGFRLEPAATFSFRAQPQPGWDGVVDCRLIEIETHRKLSWNWVAGDIDTVVTFTLTPTSAGTSLNIVQSGFAPAQKREFGGARYGWNMMSNRLIELLARMP